MPDSRHALGALFGDDGPLAEALPGFRPRREQVAMAQAVAETLDERGTLLVEAGTGTGKTFAYLVPALLSGRHVIVSTGTRTLQDQLYHRDLPLIARALGRPIRIALLKGRANYLCRHRLKLALSTPDLPGLERGRRRALQGIERWAAVTRTGDIAELESVPDNDPVWLAATSTRENCLGPDCPDFRDCHVVQARREAQAADLVIVNHHLLLADMAIREEGFGELLPGTDAVILDEAHQFPDIAAQFFGTSVGGRALLGLARDTLAELTRAGLLDATARADLEALEQAVGTAHRALSSLGERLEWPDVPDAFFDAAQELLDRLQRLYERYDVPELESAGVRQCGRRAYEANGRLQTILSMDEEAGLRWVEWSPRTFTVQFTPFEVAARLRANAEARPCAWIHTSATLAVGEDFSHYAERVGAADASTLLIPSPFDYANQARLYLPRGLPEPADRAFTGAVIETALPLIRAAGGRAFVLFTSHRALTEGAAWLRRSLEPTDTFPLLVQGDAPRDALLRRFRELGNAVLMGTGSFWEGVDVRGPALSLVVIDKLPFASPDDPLLKARLEGLRRQGKNPFVEYQLPQAVLALKQGVGRLIRDPDDYGVVVLTDPRLRTKGYGRQFIASLPPMARTDDPAAAVAFLRQHLGALAPAGAA
jgi:ATP-dependent DNA helicase DinG